MIVNKPEKKKKLSKYSGFLIVMAIVFTAITGKLIYLQVYKHEDYKEQADTTSTKFVSDTAPRGKIYDEDGNVLATNIQTYAIKYTKTEQATKHFYETIDSIVGILAENDEKLQDSLMLKVNENNEPYFEYSSTSQEGKDSEELLFKRDRGMNEPLEVDLRKAEKLNEEEDLTDAQIDKINEQLLEIGAKETFEYLVKAYDLIDLLNPTDEEKEKYNKMKAKELTSILLEKYSYSELRTYMLIKDALKIQSLKGYKSVTIAKNINRDTAFTIYQKLNDLPGIDITLEPVRTYPYNELASSVIGYLSPISSSAKEKYELRGYDVSTDLIGVSGIESAFEEQLKGVKGGTTVKVNSAGRTTQELFKLESYPGNNVHLTIDKNIQWVAEQALADTMEEIKTLDGGIYSNANRGAVVVTEVKTGRILALVSLPNYDPNEFAISGQLSNEKTIEYFSPDLESYGQEFISGKGLNKTVDDLFPKDSSGVRQDLYDIYPRAFYNYATQGLIPPGSTFKIMTGIAGVESGAISADEVIYDYHTFDQHKELGSSFAPTCLGYHGNVGMAAALEVSCNYFFYETGYRIYKNGGSNIAALDNLAQYAWKFGLGVDPNGQENPSTGIEIEENFGQVYNFTSWKKRAIASAKIDLANYLEQGSYANNGSTFVPVDYSKNEEDEEDVKEAKEKLKEKIYERFNQIGTGEDALGTDAFAKYILNDVTNLMNVSEKYAQNLDAYNAGRSNPTTIEEQAKKVANVIATFVVQDKASEITSPAQLIYASIGQGMNTFTPLQLAQYVSTIANGGTRYKMHLVDKVTTPDGELVEEFSPQVLDEIDLSEDTLRVVMDGMSRVNTEDSGTAAQAFSGFPIATGGKTGTADFREDQYDLGRAPYATYLSFAPFDDPEIAVAVVAYDGGHGGYVAKVARAVYEMYFKDELLQTNPDYASSSETFANYVLNVPEDNKETE